MSFAQQDAQEVIDIVRAAARAEIVPRYRRLGAGAIQTKSSIDDLVTEADLAAEEAMTKAITSAFPGCRIVGEEAVAADPSVLDQVAGPGVTFIIDPIDGTSNYANGVSVFGVILSVIENGRSVFGLLYDPLLDDWVMAFRGGGAWFGRPAEDPVRLVLDQAPGQRVTGFVPLFLFPREVRADVAAAALEFDRFSTLRCSCHEYRQLVTGGADFLMNGMLNVWDHAAGVLAMEEAGGVVRLLDGRPYDPVMRTGRLLVARTSDIFTRAHGAFAPILGDNASIG